MNIVLRLLHNGLRQYYENLSLISVDILRILSVYDSLNKILMGIISIFM